VGLEGESNILHILTQWGALCFLLFVDHCDCDKLVTDKVCGTRGIHGENYVRSQKNFLGNLKGTDHMSD
jgi:hypothetical protein